MTDRLKFEHRQPNANWQDSLGNTLLPFELAAQRATTHATAIFNLAVNMTINAPMDEDDIDALIHQSEAIKNQMLDLQEMVHIAENASSAKRLASKK